MLDVISNQNAALLLFIFGAICVYVELLWPGLIVPGAAGATMLLLSIVAFSNCAVQWPGVLLMGGAAVCFLLATTGIVQSSLIALGTVALAGSTLLLADLSVAFPAGVPFALLTGYLVQVAIRARRNKSGGR